MTRRYSLGGQVVAASLTEVGLDRLPAFSSLVETTLQSELEVVMVQNAWNVAKVEDFWRLLRPYPLGWKFRAVGRRVVARRNIRRAKKVVCLTEAVAELTRSVARGHVIVTPVAGPLGPIEERSPRAAPVSGTAVVVGTVTWYKRPLLALEVLRRHAPDVRHVTFLGRLEEARVWDQIVRRAAELNISVNNTSVAHGEMPERYGSAAVTVIPSALESLGFGVVEALNLGHRVLASNIPAHREAAAALGGQQPEWFDADGSIVPGPKVLGRRVDRTDVVGQWRRVGQEMTARS